VSQTLIILSVVLVFICAIVNLVRRQWGINLIALALQYIGVFLLQRALRSLMMSTIPLLVGIMMTVTLWVTLIGTDQLKKPEPFKAPTSGEVFRAVAGLVTVIFVVLLVPTIRREVFPEAGSYLLLGSIGLIALSLLQLGMKTEPLYIIIGLLSFLSGFQLLYAALETSALLEALFAVLNLGLGLTGAFFLVKAEDEAQ